MIVADASAIVHALVGREPSEEVLAALSGEVAVPHLVDVEVLSALRGLALGHQVTDAEAEQAWRVHLDLAMTRYELEPVAARVWQLRHRYSAYDATYLALAEALDAPLVTCDAALTAGGHRAEVTLVGR